MDMVARSMAKGARETAVKQASAKTTATDKRIFSLPNSTDGSLSVEGVKGKTVQNLTENIHVIFSAPENNVTQSGDNLKKRVTFNASPSKYIFGFLGGNFRKLLKPNTVYTAFLKINTNVSANYGTEFAIRNSGSEKPLINNIPLILSAGDKIYQIKFTTLPDLPIDAQQIYINLTFSHSPGTYFEFSESMILEGDWTNKEVPPYFEGIKSVGEAEGKLAVKSMTPNIINPNLWEVGGITWLGGADYTGATDRMRTKGFIEVITGLTIKTNERVYFLLYDKNFTYLGTGKVGDKSGTLQGYIYKVENEVKFIRLVYGSIADLSFVSKITGTYLNEAITNSTFGESKIEIPLTEPLRSLPNGVADEIKDGKIIRRVGKRILDGNLGWGVAGEFKDPNIFGAYVTISEKTNTPVGNGLSLMVDKLTPEKYGTDRKGVLFENGRMVIVGLDKAILSTPDITGFKAWFNNNPVTLFFELATPTETPITIPAINSFTNGIVTVENNLWPNELTVSYSTNVVARIVTSENTLSGVLASTLTLADKELAMKSIPSLATGATLTDAVAKINQILTIWR